MTTSSINADRRFIVQWIIACSIGFVIAGFMNDLILKIFGTAVGKISFQRLVFPGIVSFAQWVVLRKYIHYASWWIPAGLATALAASTIYSVLALDIAALDIPVWFIARFFIEIFFSFPEWLVLRKELPGSIVWLGVRATSIIVSEFAGIYSWAILDLLNLGISFGKEFVYNGLDDLIRGGVSGVIAGSTYGIMTGLTLYLMLSRKVRMQENSLP